MKDTLQTLARQAGLKLLELRSHARQQFDKGHGDFATDADFAAQAIILAGLANAFPDIPVLAEEQTTHVIPGGTFFTIDPLDGTFNYTLGTDTWGVILSYIEQGAPKIGVVYLPVSDRMVVAETGCGCTVDGQPARLQQSKTLESAIINVDLGCWLTPEITEDYVIPLLGASLVLRSIGSSAVNFVELATGGTALAANLTGAKIWDLAAGHVICTEAGGIVCDLQGNPLVWDRVPMNALFAAQPSVLNQLRAKFNQQAR